MILCLIDATQIQYLENYVTLIMCYFNRILKEEQCEKSLNLPQRWQSQISPVANYLLQTVDKQNISTHHVITPL